MEHGIDNMRGCGKFCILDVDLLRDSFYALKRQASPGVDGVLWQEYESGLVEQSGELFLSSSFCCFAHTVQSLKHAFPALCQEHA
jgi:hypothetical protein